MAAAPETDPEKLRRLATMGGEERYEGGAFKKRWCAARIKPGMRRREGE
jgi:hypothetical protein